MKEVSRFAIKDPLQVFLDDTIKTAQFVLRSMCTRRDSGEWPANGAVFRFTIPIEDDRGMWLAT